MNISIKHTCHLCSKEDSELLLKINEKPAGETDYGISKERYYREVRRCNNCGVFFNSREDDLISADFYEGQYNEAIEYGSLEKRFTKIIGFPFHKSDNKNRVQRIVNLLYQKDLPISGMEVLDVGAGTCVFLYEMKKFGFKTYSVDPDPSSKAHSEKNAMVDQAFCGTLDSLSIEKKFDLITFNKVLEHVKDPVSILDQAKSLLKPNGHIYIELPDGEGLESQNNIYDRSEFFIDHHTTFNKKSFSFLVSSAGLELLNSDQIIDPSGKCTIFGVSRPI